jgi:hypothetical protein
MNRPNKEAAHNLRIASLMLADSAERMGKLLAAARTPLRTLYVAALDVHRDAGVLSGLAAAAGKRDNWPSMTEVYSERGAARQRRAERLASAHDREALAEEQEIAGKRRAS